MLLLLGDPNDLTAAYMGWLAKRRGIATVALAEDRYGVDWWVNVSDDSGFLEIVFGDERYGANQISGAFIRLNPEPALPPEWSLSSGATELFIQERRSALCELVESLRCPVVNRPSAGRSNGAKPVHMAHLARAGFGIPAWIASNEHKAVHAFLDRCPEGAVVKAGSGLRSHVRSVDETYLARLQAGTTPSIVQRYVPGHEVRVHVVESQVFGSRVDADTIDYRFDSENVSYSVQVVPDQIARLCTRAAANDDLVLAGLDFRVDGTGNWWCLEMNPVPTFLPYEASTGQAIGDAVLDYLLDQRYQGERESPLAAFIRTAGVSATRSSPSGAALDQ